MTVFSEFAEFMSAYDASGSEGDRDGTLVVVGLVASERKWERFQDSWHKVLVEFEVPYLHMRELNHRKSGEGAYGKWKDDDDAPRQFLKKLVKSVKSGINKTFCYGTLLKDYHDVNKVYKLREGAGSPYVVTAGSCYDLVNAWMRRKYPKQRVLHVFEKGDCGQDGLAKLAERHKQLVIPIPKCDPVTKERYIPFQAADLVAGAYRNAAGMMGRVQRFEDYGEVFNDIVRMLPQRSLIHHTETLRAICEANPDKYPKR